MPRYIVHMTFEAPGLMEPVQASSHGGLLPGRGFRHLAGRDGRAFVLASVRAGSPADAAAEIVTWAQREWVHVGHGPLRMIGWTASPDVARVGAMPFSRRRSQGFRPGHGGRSDGDWPDDGFWGGLAGVREPRRPPPSPGAMSAALDVPREWEHRGPEDAFSTLL